MTNRIFIERPVLSTVISIIIVILGILGYTALPVSLYPDIAPPTVQVTAIYPGANAQTVLDSVVVPLEEQINGVEHMTYMTSTASNSGEAQISVYFDIGTNPDIAAVDVQNRVAQASSLLPQEVIQAGVTTAKRQTSRLLIFTMYSPNGQYDQKFIENYARINLLPKLQRVDGVGAADAFLTNTYAMRIWLKPAAMASYDLTPSDVIAALNEQSFVAAPGSLGKNSKEPFEYTLRYKGRLSTAEAYKNVIIRAGGPRSELLRLDDVARVELGAQTYAGVSLANGAPGVGFFVTQTAGSNAQQVVASVQRELQEAAKSFPTGISYAEVYNANNFLNASTEKVYRTFIEAFILVFLVVFVFLQDLRSTLIPAIAVPVSIVGTLFFLYLFGYSLNLLTLFALVLAIGIVVDDAIIVVEIVHAKLEEGAETSLEAAIEGMREITGAIISVSLVMAAIFVPVTFLGGSSGIFFQQFGVTLAVAILISALNALTLSPALCVVFLSPETATEEDEPQTKKSLRQRFHDGFDAAFDATRRAYVKTLRFMGQHLWLSLVTVALFVALFAWLIQVIPTGLIPDEDQGVFFANISLPPAASIDRTQKVVSQVDDMLAKMDIVKTRVAISGFGLISGAGSSYGFVAARLKPWSERDRSVEDVINEMRRKTASIKEANIVFFSPPVISGFGNTSGFTVHVQDRQNASLDRLAAVSKQVQGALMARPSIKFAASYFSTDYPQYRVDVDVAKAMSAGFTVRSILDVLQVYFGGLYVANFSRFGKLYRVYVQAGPQYRRSTDSLKSVFVKNKQGQMAPITSFVTLKRVYGPENISRFNLLNAVQITGEPAQGYSTGDAIAAIKSVFRAKIPPQYTYAFSGLTREEEQTSGQEVIVFLLSVVFVYFLLSAQYESYVTPWSVILALPVGLASLFAFAGIFGIDNNIYLQISAIMLLGLLAKNAILIVEFGVQRRRGEGMDIIQAAVRGAEARLRPILMVSFSFIAGLMPLAFASGVNANANRSIGIGTAGGMLVGTFVGLLVVPSLFIIFEKLHEKISGVPEAAKKAEETDDAEQAEESDELEGADDTDRPEDEA